MRKDDDRRVNGSSIAGRAVLIAALVAGAGIFASGVRGDNSISSSDPGQNNFASKEKDYGPQVVDLGAWEMEVNTWDETPIEGGTLVSIGGMLKNLGSEGADPGVSIPRLSEDGQIVLYMRSGDQRFPASLTGFAQGEELAPGASVHATILARVPSEAGTVRLAYETVLGTGAATTGFVDRDSVVSHTAK